MEEWNAGSERVVILSMMCDSKLISSKREARRLIEQGAVTVDGEKITRITEEISLETPVVLKVGKRKVLRIMS